VCSSAEEDFFVFGKEKEDEKEKKKASSELWMETSANF
jgi:hypothetical protein